MEKILLKVYWKKYWEKINIDIINWEKLFHRPVDRWSIPWLVNFKLPCYGSKRDTQECWYVKLIIVFTPKLISPSLWSHTLKCNIQANERLTKVKAKLSTIWFDIFDLSFIFFIPMSQTIYVIYRSGLCYFLQASN